MLSKQSASPDLCRGPLFTEPVLALTLDRRCLNTPVMRGREALGINVGHGRILLEIDERQTSASIFLDSTSSRALLVHRLELVPHLLNLVRIICLIRARQAGSTRFKRNLRGPATS